MTTFSKQRIAIVSASFPPLGGGGVSTSHFNLFMALKKEGYTVKGFTFRDGFSCGLLADDMVRTGLPPFFVWLLAKAISMVFKLFGERKAVWQFSNALSGALSGLLLVRHIRKFRPDILILPDHGAPGAFFPRFKKCRTIFVTHHNPTRFLHEKLFAYGDSSCKDAVLALSLEKKSVTKADAVICPSNYMKNVFLKTYSFSKSISVIPNVIDIDWIKNVSTADMRTKYMLPHDSPIVYIPSAGSPIKGSSFVFEIIRRLSAGSPKKIAFYLSGDVGEQLLRSFEFLPDSAIIITTGKISYEKNISNVKACTICISPTIMENFSMALLEAQACGLPVVTFDTGGNKEIIVHGKTGYIVPFMDIEQLIHLSKNLLVDKNLCAEMSINAGTVSIEEFSPEKIVRSYTDLFDSLDKENTSLSEY